MQTDEVKTKVKVPLREAFWTWCRVASLSFGGPAGQIAVMHRIIVDEKGWIKEDRFLHALNYCMLLPGPEAQQLATYIGWLMHRKLGGLLAGLLFILPGAIAILVLSIIYATYEQTPIVQSIFFGLKPAVMAIVLQAVLRIGDRILKNRTMVWLAAFSFVAIFFFEVPFPILILAAGLIGLTGGKLYPDQFHVLKPKSKAVDSNLAKQTTADVPEIELYEVQPSIGRAISILLTFGILWIGPILGMAIVLGPRSVYFQESLFFSQAAVVTFGGAYSVLAYIAQQAVEKYGWLQPGEMLDGLGLAETTPGPLIMVVQFVGFMGAFRNPGELDPLLAGVLGSLVTTWVTFVPCFLWIFLGAPYIEKLRNNRGLSSALSAITAAVVGVIMNLAVWFSLHTLFARVDSWSWSGLRILYPDFTSINLGSLLIAIVALMLTFYWKRSMPVTLAVSTALGIAWYLITG